MAAHERGNRHEEILAYRAHRMTMLQTTGYYDDRTWCNICGKESRNREAFDEHLRGAGHKEAVKVENAVWMNRFAIMSLGEELLRRGEDIPSWCPRIVLPFREGALHAGSSGSAGTASAGTGLKRAAGAAMSGVGVAAEVVERQGAPTPVLAATQPCAPTPAQPAEDLESGSDDGESYGMPIDSKIGWIASGVQGLAAISSGIADDLGVVRNKVDEMEVVLRSRSARDKEVFATIDTLSAGMQSMAEQSKTLEANVLGAVKELYNKLEELVGRPSTGVLGLPLTATVVLSEARKA